MRLSYPWRPTRRVVLGALLITLVVFGGLGLIQLIPNGPVKHVAETAFHILVVAFAIVMLILSVNARVRRAEEEGWDESKRDD